MLSKIQAEWKSQKNLDLKIAFEQPFDPKTEILANAVLLQIALDNIVSNAFKFSNNLPVNILIIATDNDFLIQINDNGPGILKEDQEDIFKPFFTRAKDQGQQGEGMGLYMAQKIIHLLKGEITTTNTEQGGCTFTIKLTKL